MAYVSTPASEPPVRRARLVRRAALVGGALTLAALTACSSQSPGPAQPSAPAEPPALDAIPRTVAVEHLHLPVERYMLTPRQALDLDEANDATVRACMRRLAAPYPAATRLRTGSAEERRALDTYTVLYRRYGLTDASEARTWGYHAPTTYSPGTTASTPANPKSLSVTTRSVLTGVNSLGKPLTSLHGRRVPQGGCLGEAERLLGARGPQGPGTDPEGIVVAIKADSFEQSMADTRVTKVFSAWSACMKSRGFGMSTPMDEVPSSNGATPSRSEIAQARADVACKARTNLVGVWFAVESAYQKAAIDQHHAELDEVTTARDATLRMIDRQSHGRGTTRS
ncbi:hypothetical protein AB0J38_07420 [Streptomyces sp. NPDC050095]|uniref:hypothetical protein n=1 Tax=unclassified Streptomyces TaxID=2593676 RepID=UPI00344571E6